MLHKRVNPVWPKAKAAPFRRSSNSRRLLKRVFGEVGSSRHFWLCANPAAVKRPSALRLAWTCRDWDAWSQDSHASRPSWSGVCVACRRRRTNGQPGNLPYTIRDGAWRTSGVCSHGLGFRPAFVRSFHVNSSKGQSGLPKYGQWRNIRASSTTLPYFLTIIRHVALMCFDLEGRWWGRRRMRLAVCDGRQTGD